ncbi:Uncharacterised protein [Legionella oakridgensis]|nr:Uncharacterised protein [Legionella oakridgensis]
MPEISPARSMRFSRHAMRSGNTAIQAAPSDKSCKYVSSTLIDLRIRSGFTGQLSIPRASS